MRTKLETSFHILCKNDSRVHQWGNGLTTYIFATEVPRESLVLQQGAHLSQPSPTTSARSPKVPVPLPRRAGVPEQGWGSLWESDTCIHRVAVPEFGNRKASSRSEPVIDGKCRISRCSSLVAARNCDSAQLRLVSNSKIN